MTEKKSSVVQPEPDSRLSALLAEYEQAKPAADEAEKRLKTITDAIKAELTAAAPGATEIDVAGHVPVHLSGREEWRLDTKALKAEDPQTYVRFARKSTKWVLTRAKGAQA